MVWFVGRRKIQATAPVVHGARGKPAGPTSASEEIEPAGSEKLSMKPPSGWRSRSGSSTRRLRSVAVMLKRVLFKQDDHHQPGPACPPSSSDVGIAKTQTGPMVDNNTKLSKSSSIPVRVRRSLSRPKSDQDANSTPKNQDGAKPARHSPTPPASKNSKPQPQPLTENDLTILFSGAPQFGVYDTDGHRRPKVAFPWNDGIKVQDMRDRKRLSQRAFSAITTRRHTRTHTDDELEGGKPGYDIGVEEVPCMLNHEGQEAGTVGFEYFLQLPISDSLSVDEAPEERRNSASNLDLLDQQPEKLGIRRFEKGLVGERLVELSEIYRASKTAGSKENLLSRYTCPELYTYLFGRFLTGPSFDAGATDPMGLKVQVESLLHTLQIKGIWYDFSKVEWRIRIGEILWASEDKTKPDEEDPEGDWTWRQILLFQLCLSSELLLRLDAISAMDLSDPNNKVELTEAEVTNFARSRTRKTDWDLVVARHLLDRVRFALLAPPKPEPKKRGFLASITGSSSEEAQPQETKPTLLFLPLHPLRQVQGFSHFTETLAWPNNESVYTDLTRRLGITPRRASDEVKRPTSAGSQSLLASPSIYSTPLATPLSAGSARNSYFHTQQRPALKRGVTQRSFQLRPATPASVDENLPANVSGWLSRSYLVGAVLPGEPLVHLLLSTLLENDPTALVALGESACLYGGFVYAGSTWWSKSCVAGRVLAALPDSKECMGWIRALTVPTDVHEQWFDLETTQVDIPNRLQSTAVQDNGGVVKQLLKDDVTAQQLSIPKDTISPGTSSLTFESLNFLPSTIYTPTSEPARTPFYRASVTFSLINTAEQQHDTASTATPYSETNHDLDDRDTLPTLANHKTVVLQHEVWFISAFPCVPPSTSKLKILHSGEEKEQGKTKTDISSTKIEPVPGHPLFEGHTYRTISAVDLFNELEVNAEWDSHRRYDSRHVEEGREVTVITCISAEEQVFARAWCAMVGEHALVSRQGVGCLGCAIREARALGVGVVVRVLEPVDGED